MAKVPVDQHEHGIFIEADRNRPSVPSGLMDDEAALFEELIESADGIHASVPWKLRDYGDDGALSEEQIRSIAERCGLDVVALRGLSWSLGRALNASVTHNLISIPRSVAAKRGAKEIKLSFNELREAERKLYQAFERLEQLSANAANGHDNAQRFREAKKLLLGSLKQSIAALQLLDQFKSSSDAVLLIAPDKGKVRDGRRSIVLGTLFNFWRATGRKISFTTDPVSWKRRGRLVDFVNAVVACVTDPSTTLNGETIRVEIDAFKRR